MKTSKVSYPPKVSALIFSMNRPKSLRRLIKTVKNYVDEIVIIDSSLESIHRKLREEFSFAKVYWLPPIGMADLYYGIGLKLVGNDWVIQFDDDEVPSRKLMEDLKRIITDSRSKVIAVSRIDRDGRQSSPLLRIFNKRYIIPTGVIHWTWASKVRPMCLDPKRYYIIHDNPWVTSACCGPGIRYAIIEAYQLGYKLLLFIHGFTERYYLRGKKYGWSRLQRALRKLLSAQLNMGKLGWLLAVTEYNIYYQLAVRIGGKLISSRVYDAKALLKDLIGALRLFVTIQAYLLMNFNEKVLIWKETFREGGPIKYMGLEDIRDFNTTGLSKTDGLNNFLKLLRRKMLQGAY